MKQESGIIKNQRGVGGDTIKSNMFFKNAIQIVYSGLFQEVLFLWLGVLF